MGSLRDPDRASLDAEELARARAHAGEDKTQRAARLARERRLAGSPTARKALAADFAAVNPLEARRADR